MTELGSVYGGALYELAASEGLGDTILAQMSALEQGFAQVPDYLRLLSVPTLGKAERCQILDDSFAGKIHPYVLNFLKILTQRGYARQFPQCSEAYRERYNQDHGILPVTAVTALPLTAEQSARLTGKLEQITGKTIALTNRVDEKCLGGVRLDFDGKRVEDTVALRLQNLRKQLKSTVL